MKKSVYYWSPCLTNVGTVKSTLNSSIALAKYNSDYEVTLLNVFGIKILGLKLQRQLILTGIRQVQRSDTIKSNSLICAKKKIGETNFYILKKHVTQEDFTK